MTELTLTERVHNLASELFEKIYEAFIAVNEDEPVTIDANYKFPIQLQIDRSTRHRFAAKYYSRPFKTSISSLSRDSPSGEEYEDPNLRRWLVSLPNNHRMIVRRIEVEQATYSSWFCRPYAHQRVGKIMRFIHGKSYSMPDLVIFASWGANPEPGEETVVVRSEGFRMSSWQSSLPSRAPGTVFAWSWEDLGASSADIDETRLVVIERRAQVTELDT